MSDLISRREVLALIQSYRTPYRREFNVEDIYDAVLHMPSAQPDLSGYSERLWRNAYERGKAEAQPKTGMWIPCDVDSRRMTNMFACSKCGSFVSLPILRYADNMEYDWCPNCGCRMKEGEEHD